MIKRSLFGVTSDGEDVYIYDIDDGKISLSVMEYGAAVVRLCVADRDKNVADIVCGFDTLYSYEHADGYQGAVVGRVANRICNGVFNLGDKQYTLLKNNGKNHLHGGGKGFSHRVWRSEVTSDCSVRFSYFSPDGEEGYPADLWVSAEYSISDGRVRIDYRAHSNADTVIALTNHSYFNLGGFDAGNALSHELCIRADRFIPTDESLIPTGEIRYVSGTQFDFRQPKAIGRDLDMSCRDIRVARGYDHCFVFEKTEQGCPKAEVRDPNSGRGMRIYTDFPCVQLYTANYTDDAEYPFKGDTPQSVHCAYCLETGIMPDSINHENFTSCILAAGEMYARYTELEFFTF